MSRSPWQPEPARGDDVALDLADAALDRVGGGHDVSSWWQMSHDSPVGSKSMVRRQRRQSTEELARRGQEIYDRTVRPVVEGEHRGQIVAIDIESGAFEVADDVLTAADRLLARLPDAQPWLVRIGSPGVYRIGARPVGGIA